MVDFAELLKLYFEVMSLSPSTITSTCATIEDSLNVMSSPTVNSLPLM